DFIGIKGSAGKMSSSLGRVVNLEDMLRVYTPELTRYLFAGTRPNTEFTISFDLDVIKIYEDYDKTERIAFGAEMVKDEGVFRRERRIYELSQVETGPEGRALIPETMPRQAPFRHLCNLIQIAGGDVDRALEGLGSMGPDQLRRLKARALCAKYWVEECAPEDFRFCLREPGEQPAGLNDAERAAVRVLRDRVIRGIEGFPDDKSCAEAIYGAAAECGLEGKALFRACYQALIGKDQGPRLANFLRSINKERLLGILAGY
ncbi:MAG: lysine--tRNA ligase, partial [Treponema sp.]|nr:lysine--tRNA ligase [Treponema sp.]